MELLWIRVVSQAGVYAAFTLYLLWALRRGAREWAPLLAAVLYAVLFEHLNMLRYAHVQGGYHYHRLSWVWIWGDVPLYIPLAWGVILATSRAMTDRLQLRFWARPFADALLALLIDVSMDAVAIRLKFWFWHGVPLDAGFFGVPADNFVGWLLVSFTFSALTRWLWSAHAPAARLQEGRRSEQAPFVPVLPAEAASCETAGGAGMPASGPRRFLKAPGLRVGLTQFLVIPLGSYAIYLGLEALVHAAYRWFHADTLRGQLNVLAGALLLFLAAALAGARPAGTTPPSGADVDKNRAGGASSRWSRAMLHAPRHIFHLFGIIGLLWVPAAVRIPALWLLAGGVWAAEASIALVAHRRQEP